jgi:hypothetical protein
VIRPLAALVALALAAPAAAFETLAVLAAGDPPSGPDADLAELAHQLRAACRDRVGGVMDVPTMRARLLGQRSNATVTELDRAYGGALAVYQNGEFESAIRTLKAIVEDLESLPESEEGYTQWVRAQLRLAHAALTIGRERDAEEAMQALARTDASIVADPDQYSPTYRRRFEAAKAKVRALPARRLQVTAEGFGGSVYVNGRLMGAAPLSVWLPAGSYRVGGASGSLHVPSFRVDLHAEDRSIVLDFALAEALRVAGGPGLALSAARRSEGIVRAGAWLGIDRVIAVTRQAEGEAVFLLGSIYDVRNGALLREGSVRTVAGGVPAANLGALATFLLTGQSSRDVKDRTDLARTPIAMAPLSAPLPAARVASAPPPTSTPTSPASTSTSTSISTSISTGRAASPSATSTATQAAAATSTPTGTATSSSAPRTASADLTLPPPRSFAPPEAAGGAADEPARPGSASSARRWLRPAAYGSALLAGVFTGLAIQQGLTARQASADAAGMVGPGGSLAPGSDPTRYAGLRSDARAATRNTYLSAGAAAAFAATAGLLGWVSRAPAGEQPAVALRF